MSLILIYTGGTIGSRRRGSAPVTEAYPLRAFKARLDRLMPAKVRPADWTAIAVRPALSENRVPGDWVALARAIDDEVRKGAAGMVVAHGTDTMLHAACMMARMLRGVPVPVVFTGSNLPLEIPGTDAVQNLAHAFRVAECQSAPGVWVSFAGTCSGPSLVLDPARARKEAFRSDCFQPLWGPALGRVAGNAAKGGPLRLTWRPKAKKSPISGKYDPCFALTPAALFWLHPGFDPRAIRRAVADGKRGIVLAAYGSGTACTVPGEYDVSAAVRAVTQRGVRVAVVSQHAGRVRDVYGSTADLVRAGAELMSETTGEAALAAFMGRRKEKR